MDFSSIPIGEIFGLGKKKVALVSLILANALVWVALFSFPKKNLSLFVFDVGEGDAIFIRGPRGQDILVDGGPDRKVLTCLGKVLPFWDQDLELVVLTHPDADHVTGLTYVLEKYEVKAILTNGREAKTRIYQRFKNLLQSEGAQIWQAEPGGRIVAEPLSLLILWPPEDIVLSRNNASVVLLASLGEFEALLPGDIEEEGERLLLQNVNLPEVEVLKVPHHGAKDALYPSFLQSLKPELSVISVGKNPYGHPAEVTLEKLQRIGSKVLRTDQQGTVRIVSNGKAWSFRTER